MKKICGFFVLFPILIFSCSTAFAESMWDQENVEPDKVWAIKFSVPLDEESAKDYIHVVRMDGEGGYLNTIEVTLGACHSLVRSFVSYCELILQHNL